MLCITSQCSTILPCSTRKISTTASPRSCAFWVECTCNTTKSPSATTRLMVFFWIRMFFKVLGEVVYKRCFAVCNLGIMLNVLCINIAVRIGLNLMLAKNAFIKVHYNFFILFSQDRGRMMTRRCWNRWVGWLCCWQATSPKENKAVAKISLFSSGQLKYSCYVAWFWAESKQRYSKF